MSFSIERQGETQDQAGDNACRGVFAHLMLTDASQVVLRPKHWTIPIQDVVAGLPGVHQALPVHVRRRTADANSTGAMLEPDDRDRQASVLVRECLMAFGCSFDPSQISHKAMRLAPDEEKTWSKFNRLFEPGALKGFIERSIEFEWHQEGSNGMRVTWASTVPSNGSVCSGEWLNVLAEPGIFQSVD